MTNNSSPSQLLSSSTNSPKRILLTGGNGFIGKNIQESFLGEKYEIIAPRSFELNLLDKNAVEEYFQDKYFDVIIHSAVKPGHRNANDLTSLFESNLTMFENLVNNKTKFSKFINLGSGAIYDTTKDITDVKEEDRFKNKGTKEHDLCKYVIGEKIEKLDNFVDLNIFGIFGKYEDYEIRFISNAICKSLFDLPITLRQNRRFSYLYIDDLMPILDCFIEKNKFNYKSYNIVPDKHVELLELAQIVKKISGKNIDIQVAQEGFGLDYTGNNSRLKKEFPQIKFTDIQQSVSSLYNYYRENLNILDKNSLLSDK